MSSTVKKARQTHCFAPGCTSGYVSSRQPGQHVSLFSVPKDPVRFEAWRRAVPRADKSLDARSALCEHHFDKQYIDRCFTHVIKGEIVEIPRERPLLKADAVPTVFPNVPAYLSKKALLYPSAKLNALVTSLENTFTHCFSVRELKSDSIMDLVSFLQLTKLTLVGCPDHSMALTNMIIKFYVLTRLHFHVKSQNCKRSAKKEKMKMLKLRRLLISCLLHCEFEMEHFIFFYLV